MDDSTMATLKADSWEPGPVYKDLGPIDAESPEGYLPGGYYPMDIGRQIRDGSNLYTVIHKLGFGRSSTVWLVKREHENDDKTSKVSFHALKILRADLSTPETYPELRTLWSLEQRRKESHPGLIHIQDSFVVSSANGDHCCIVLPLLGPSLCDKRVLEAMSCDTRQSVCEQLAHAVNYIHAFDVYHTDLNPLKVRFTIPRIENISEASLRGMLPGVVSHTIRRVDGSPVSKHAPRCVIETASFQNLDFDSLKKVTIISFGRAFTQPMPRSPLQQRPTAMLPPELLFGHLTSRESDIWQLACLLFLVQTRNFPFLLGNGYDHPLREMTRLLGPIPDSWAGKYQWSKYKIGVPPQTICDKGLEEWFDKKQPTKRLQDQLGEVEPRKAGSMATLLRKMLAWEPEKRPRSGEVYHEVLLQSTY